MPNSRHQRNHRHKEEDTHNNNSPHAPVVTVVCTRETSAAPGPSVASSGVGSHTGNHSHQNDNADARPHQKCCSPGVCPTPDDTIDPDEPFDAVRILCNNENCGEGCWMHKDCFEDFETSVLAYLRSCGRARSWSEKQRLQNLWTKKGYDLAFKACDCKCGRGHIRKDLDYIPKPFNENSKKQKKHKKKNDKPMPVVSTTHKANSHSNQTVGHPSGIGHGHSAGSAPTNAPSHASSNHTRGHQFLNHAAVANGGGGGGGGRGCSERKGKKSSTMKNQDTNKMSDSNGNLQHHQLGTLVDNHTATNKTSITTNNHHHLFQAVNLLGAAGGHYNQHNNNPQLRLRTNSVSSTGSAGSHSSSGSIGIPSSAGSPSPISSSPVSGDMFFKSRKSSDASTGSNDSGSSSSGFRHRVDLSAFAALPRNKQNPYHIRMEDSGTSPYSFAASWSLAAARAHSLAEVAAESGTGSGCCDLETRNFVLSNLLSKKTSCVRCALCKSLLPVFDCFPLLDGTFFLSPQSYDETAIQVIWDGRLQFLNAACLSCLEGHSQVRCLSCKQPWDGCNLVVGSMYTYDIFAATPCCQKRLTCKCCLRAVVDIAQGLEFYSQYSQMIICPYCKANDYHFIRSLAETFSTLSLRSSSDGGGAQRASGPICH